MLVQENWVDWPDAVNDRVGNILLGRIMGAEVRLDPRRLRYRVQDSWKQALDDVEARGGTPYADPGRRFGPSARRSGVRRLGGRGAAAGAGAGVFFDTIVVCSVTGSTHAGMIAGFAGQDRPRRVIGIDASAKLAETRDQVARIARTTAELIGLGRELRDDEITVLEGWAGDFYGIPVQSTLDAIRLTGRLEGMIIDPVYEGKSMAGLIDLVGRRDRPTSTCCTRHLGGHRRLNAYSALFSAASCATAPATAHLIGVARATGGPGPMRLRLGSPAELRRPRPGCSPGPRRGSAASAHFRLLRRWWKRQAGPATPWPASSSRSS